MKFNNLFPKQLEITDLVTGEVILAVVKRHVFYFLKRSALIFILSVLVFGLFIFLYANLGILPIDYQDLGKTILLWVFAIIILVVCFRILYLWTDYQSDNIVITSQRVIFVDRHFIYGKTLREIELTKITTVTYERNSFLENLIGFSRLIIDSADDGKHITFDYTPKVEEVRTLIAEATQRMFDKRYMQSAPSVNNAKDISENNSMANKTVTENSAENLINELNTLRSEYDFLRQKVSILEEELFKLKNSNQ